MAVVKLCGIKSKEDAALMNKVEPDYVGFILAPGKYQVSAVSACRLLNVIRHNRPVDVFVNEQPATIAKIAKQTGLDVIQLHGDESDADTRQLKENCNCEIRKALRIGQIEDMDAATFPHAGRLLVDSYVQGLRGEGGKQIAIDLLQKLSVSRLVIADGICRGNIKEILTLQPYGVDVSSALETSGKKDKEEVRTFVKQLRGWTEADQAL